MSTKQLEMKTIRELPVNASWQEIEERIHFLSGLEKTGGEVIVGREDLQLD